MSPSESVRKKALALPARDRARLARDLIDSLDDAEPDPGAEREWADEVERRLEALDRGEAKTEPAEVAFKKIEERHRRKKR